MVQALVSLLFLAEKLGAKNILAVDYDDWCIENSKENIEQNNCINIQIVKADTAKTATPFDIVIANINKNIIQDNFALIGSACRPLGQIILSGLLIEDEADVLAYGLLQAKWQHLLKPLIKVRGLPFHFSA